MTCIHLKKLYDVLGEEQLRISSGDLVHVVCPQCGEKEVCPAVLMEEYEATHPDDDDSSAESEADG